MQRHEGMDPTRRPMRLAAALVGTTVALTGCGSGDEADAASPADPVAQEEGTGTSREDTDPPGEPETVTGDTVTVTDATGEITVPVTSENVLALDELNAVNLLALGVTPSTTIDFVQEGVVDAILEAEGIEPITGAPFTLDLEVLAQEDAALAVGFAFPSNLEMRDAINDNIAPTVLIAALDVGWREQLGLLAAVTGTSDRLAELEASLDTAIEELRADITAAGLEGATVSFLEEGPGGISLPQTGRIEPTILEQVGLARPAVELVEGDSYVVEISEETLGAHDADIMIVEVYGVEPSINESPLRTDDGVSAYVFGWREDVVGAFRIVTDLRRILLDGEEPLDLAEGQLQVWDEFLSSR
jgi:ABC-type Fe3+-hydroxamate transport system substrate-binding protein